MISDTSVFVLRCAIIAMALLSSGLLGWFSWLSRHDLTFWQGLTRASLMGLVDAVAFASLSSLAGWDPDLRVILLAISVTGLFTGLVMTAWESWRNATKPDPVPKDHYRWPFGGPSDSTRPRPH